MGDHVSDLHMRFGTAGNKQERAAFMAVFLALSVWTVLVVGYFLLLQTCAIYLDAWLSWVFAGPGLGI